MFSHRKKFYSLELLAFCFESFNCGSLGIGELNLVSAAETVFTLGGGDIVFLDHHLHLIYLI